VRKAIHGAEAEERAGTLRCNSRGGPERNRWCCCWGWAPQPVVFLLFYMRTRRFPA
jgi:hypothetical protein